MEQFVVWGVPATVVIVLIVELLKRFGWVKGDWAILAALGVGVTLAVLGRLGLQLPAFEEWYNVVGGGLLAGFSAAGLFDGSKAVLARKDMPPPA